MGRMAMVMTAVALMVVLSAGVAVAASITGTEDRDVLDGSGKNETISGRGGPDTLGAGGGDTTGGDGGDEAGGGTGADEGAWWAGRRLPDRRPRQRQGCAPTAIPARTTFRCGTSLRQGRRLLRVRRDTAYVDRLDVVPRQRSCGSRKAQRDWMGGRGYRVPSFCENPSLLASGGLENALSKKSAKARVENLQVLGARDAVPLVLEGEQLVGNVVFAEGFRDGVDVVRGDVRVPETLYDQQLPGCSPRSSPASARGSVRDLGGAIISSLYGRRSGRVAW